MQKDFAREIVVVGGVEVQGGGDLEARVREHCSGLRAVDDSSAVFPPQRPKAAEALAKAALRAVWRTRVGLDAWDRAQKHLEGKRAADAATEAHMAEVMSSTSSKAPSLCDGSTVQASDDDDVSDAEDHALVSRPTEPPTTIDAFVDGRVVCTAYSHLSEVRCDGAGERSFMHVAVRTTFRFNAPPSSSRVNATSSSSRSTRPRVRTRWLRSHRCRRRRSRGLPSAHKKRSGTSASWSPPTQAPGRNYACARRARGRT